MHSSKSKSGLSDVANNKDIAAGKNGRLRPAKMDGDSPSPQKNPSFSINGSPNSADSKPAVSRRSTKSSATPDKYSPLLKGSESQAQEGLRKAKEKLFFEEIKKANVLEELSRAMKAVEEVNKMLGEALLALKNAEENSELREFRADESEQSADEAARRREEEWRLALKICQETYEVMLDEAKYEIVCLKKAIEKSEAEAGDLRAEWVAKEMDLRAAIEKADEEIASIRVERDRATENLARKKFLAKSEVIVAIEKEKGAPLLFKKKRENGDSGRNTEYESGRVISDNGKEMVSEKFQLIGQSVKNGGISVSKQQLLQKRKKDLLNKFGDLLKKKSASE